jgi:gamma-glutamyltranspeptidase/glutathione hydrolase
LGRSAFYGGDVAGAIVSATNQVLTSSDLERTQAEWIDPISLEVMGWRGWTIPPNSQGYLTLAAAWLFAHLDPPRDPQDPGFIHAAIEAYRSVAWERDDLVADPDHRPAVSLLDPARLGARLAQISPTRRGEWRAPRPAGGGTAYLAVRDEGGMGVSLIQSNFHGIGARIGAGTGGFFLHDRGSGFTLQPGHPNELAPGKRPLHTLSPTLWTEGDRLRMLLGTRGGDFQPQTLLQIVAHMRWAGLSGSEALRQPRWATSEWREKGGTVAVEPHLDPAAVTELRRRGHEIRSTGQWMAGWGPVAVITVHDRYAIGAADPRVAATAAKSI